MTYRSVEAQALAYARQLDATLAAGPDDAVHDTLVFDVGELCGGLSANGFAADLKVEIDRYEAEQLEGFGRISATGAREAAAGNWLDPARAAMARHEMAALDGSQVGEVTPEQSAHAQKEAA